MCNRDIVGVLPVNPIHATKFGFYSIFAYAKALAQTEQLSTVYGINICGKPGAGDLIPKLQDSVEFLEISPTRWWIDSSITTGAMSSEAEQLLERGFIKESEREIRRCSCGNVEYLGGVTLFGKGKTLIDGKYTMCCHSQVFSRREKVLLTAPLPLVKTSTVFPVWANSELTAVLKTLEGSQLLVSRKTKRIFQVISSTGVSWELDNDMLWWLYLQWLKGDGFNVQHLVVGASVIRQAGVLLAFSSLLGINLPKTIHCLPKVLFEPVRGVQTLEQVVSRFGKTRTTNALVWSSLSARKQFTLSGSVFPNMCHLPPSQILVAGSRNLLWKKGT